MPLWSGAPRSRPVRSQAQQPNAKPSASTTHQTLSESTGSSTRNTAQANKVPNVPGANGARPEPNPKAIQRDRRGRMKAKSGRAGRSPGFTASASTRRAAPCGAPGRARPSRWEDDSPEVVKGSDMDGQGLLVSVEQPNARPGIDLTDPGEGQSKVRAKGVDGRTA